MNRKTIDLRSIIVAANVLELVPAATAKRFKILPVALKDDVLFVAVSPDANVDAALEQLESLTGHLCTPLVAESENSLKKAIERYYSGAGAAQKNISAAQLFDRMMNRALQMRASDVHVTPNENGGTVKFRIDGQLLTDMELSPGTLSELTTVIKITAKLDIAEKRTPLDGNINLNLLGDALSLRVATIPTIYGEHITLRLLSQNDSTDLDDLENLGLSARHLELYKQAIREPNGIILLSGPTGSGKTTTLYAALRQIRTGGTRHIVSIEDPVEKPVPGVTQVKIDADNERITFHKALRSILRHDPDVIMIGEIRDNETADIAVKSALTGHLVLSTLHTNSAAGILTRLLNLDIPPFLAASTLRLAMAQRLVRMPCRYCATQRPPTEEECSLFGFDPDDKTILVPKINGCSFCANTGYAGRTALYELIPIDKVLRRMILQRADEDQIAHYAYDELGLPSIKTDAIAKMVAFKTSAEEVRAILSTVF